MSPRSGALLQRRVHPGRWTVVEVGGQLYSYSLHECTQTASPVSIAKWYLNNLLSFTLLFVLMLAALAFMSYLVLGDSIGVGVVPLNQDNLPITLTMKSTMRWSRQMA